MVRTQIQLTEKQAAALKRLSEETGRPVAALVRESVDTLLASRGKPDREELLRRVLVVAGKFKSGHTDISRRHDDYLADDFAG